MERARGEGKETRLMPSLPVKAGSWQQEMYAGHGTLPRDGVGGQESAVEEPWTSGRGEGRG